MAILKILQYPNPRLHLKAAPVEDVKAPEIQSMIDDMFETLSHTQNCAGLSATQLDIKNPKRITIINDFPDTNQPICLVNPVIVQTEGETEAIEGCMSIYPDYIHAKIKRPEKITFTALDRDGNPLEIAAQDFFARCVQHEIDHLDGILFIDHLSRLKRMMIDKKIAKIRSHKSLNQ